MDTTKSRTSYKSLYLEHKALADQLQKTYDELKTSYEDLQGKYEIISNDLEDRIKAHSKKCQDNHKSNPEALKLAQRRYYYRKRLAEGKPIRYNPFEKGEI
jgi:hypothetical protein